MNCILKNLSITLLFVSSCASSSLLASELKVLVEGEVSPGQISCALFDQANGFPMDASKAMQQFAATDAKSIEFIFKDLKPGKYALAVMNDTNGNTVLDKNFLGIPKEPWGVSNNVRPSLRAPKFEEATFEILPSQTTNQTIRISK